MKKHAVTKVKPSEESMFDLLDRITGSTGYWPSLHDAHVFGYSGPESWFYECQKRWGNTLEEKPPKRHGATRVAKEYVPKDLAAEALAARTHMVLRPETAKADGRPFRKAEDSLSPTQLAIRQYYRAEKQIGLEA